MGEYTGYINNLKSEYYDYYLKTKVENPKVSVIVPVFNAEEYVEKCLASIIKQTLKEIEIIIVDDGSTDYTPQIINTFKDLDKRIKVITQDNSGPSLARNSGIQEAKGEYITFIDADDWIDNNYIEKLYDAIIRNDADIAVTTIIRWRKNNQKYRVNYTREKVYEKLEDKIKACKIPKCCYACCKLYKTELIKNTAFKPHVLFEDVLWLPNVIKQSKKLVTVPDTNYYYRVNSNSIVKRQPDDKQQIDSYNSHKYIVKFFEENNLKLDKKYKQITKKTVYFGKIPIAKIKEYNGKNIFYLFNLFPVIKYRDFDSHYIFRIFGIRISIRHKTYFYCPPATTSGVTENKRTPQLIVSLTSHPPRIKTASISINTILHQTVKPDKLILWLADSQFRNKELDLPMELLNLRKYGLEIRWCKDLGSYKKLIPSLKEFPDDIIVTADDDLYYEEDWLESLYSAYLNDSNNIYVRRAVKMKIVNNKIVSYPRDTQLSMEFDKPTFENQLMGGSGCLYPPNSLHEDIFDVNNFLLLVPTHDDIYFWFMAMLKGTKIGVVRGYESEMLPIDSTEGSSLCRINNKKGRGIEPDEAFIRMVKRYPEVLKILKGQKKVSVVIPTLQKNKELLYNLLASLDKDDSVSEIIVIDNSLKGVQFSSSKLRVIIPDENLFVNPSWNLGVKEAEEDIVAILNDDITISENFCSNVIERMVPNMGIIGYNVDFVETSEEILPPPKNTDFTLEKITSRCKHFAIAMFFFKTSFYEIPSGLKIYYGDDWLIEQNNKTRHRNYVISGQKIYHFESMTCKSKEFSPYSEMDTKEYEKLTKKWWHNIFSVKPVYRGIKITLLGIKIMIHYNKNH